MGDPKYLKDYVAEYGRLGGPAFERTYGHAVLLGIGLVGALNDAAAARGQTMAVRAVGAGADASASLRGRVWQLKKGGDSSSGISVGRDPNNDVVIPEYSVSHRHCELVLTPTSCQIRDMGSTNGTQVANQRLMKGRLLAMEDGAELILGRYLLRFVSARSFMQSIQRQASPK